MKDKSFKIFSSSALKIIAMVSMLTDHIAASGIIYKIVGGSMGTDIYRYMRMAGRLAFPIYLFLIIEGFVHTKDINRYIIRIVLFALLSEIPFDMAFCHRLFDFNYQNVMWTLLICVVMLYFMKKYPDWKFLTVVISCITAALIRCDYTYVGPLAVACMYMLREKVVYRNLSMALIFAYEPAALLALIPINTYSGKRGINLKYFFYLFYPLHLVILVLIRLFY